VKEAPSQAFATASQDCYSLAEAAALALGLALEARIQRAASADSHAETRAVGTTGEAAAGVRTLDGGATVDWIPPLAEKPEHNGLAPSEPTHSGGPRPRAFLVAEIVPNGAPTVDCGVLAEGVVAWRRFSLGLGLRALFPVSGSSPTGSVRTVLGGGELVPCWSSGGIGVCGLASLGVVHASVAGAVPSSVDALFAAPGARVFGEASLGQHTSARLQIDALVPLTPVRVSVGAVHEWTLPIVVLSLGLGLVMDFT
jgi:hypothetical protein